MEHIAPQTQTETINSFIRMLNTKIRWLNLQFLNVYCLVMSGYLSLKHYSDWGTGKTTRSFSTETRRGLLEFVLYCRKLPPRALNMPDPQRPIEVSIIIPVFNQWKYTKACINSILEICDESINYEIILADDCSTDETVFAVDHFPGIIISKTPQNVGFLRNCNHAAKRARGRYILLLNNDTIVLFNWLSSLYQTIELDQSVAMVGSKLLNVNGTIQEAGSNILQNGQLSLMGCSYPRMKPHFNQLREVDYVSGCSMLVRRSFWESVGGFDERYQGAYYEDPDLAMTCRELGLSVIYQPKSEVVHFAHKSYSDTRYELGSANRLLFIKKWHATLAEEH